MTLELELAPFLNKENSKYEQALRPKFVINDD